MMKQMIQTGLLRRIVITMIVLTLLPVAGLVATYEVFKVNWISFMEIQPSFRPMEDPLPIPRDSVPIEGAAYLPGEGAPDNPVATDALSLQRGQQLYDLNCALCHGPEGQGHGAITEYLLRKPADLTGENVTRLSDGDIFLIITYGVPNLMPALRENLEVRDRWDVVNYVRSLGR